MLFNTLQFLVFFTVLWSVCRVLPRGRQVSLLLPASLVFYMLWHPVYLVLLLFEIGVNYALLRGIERSRRPRLWLALSVVFTLALLAYFKYTAMIVESVFPLLLDRLGSEPILPEVFLPLGISFYSFQIIALAVDTSRGTAPRVESIAEYALFVSFFPQLIAGPIMRGHELIPQIRAGGVIATPRTRRGLWLIASGLFKKMVLADFMLAPFVDVVFDSPGVGSAPAHWLALYGFAFQIYFDFSGYTDMARGLGCLLGYELPLNFREPYLSRDPSEFWRRWHITLSAWLRDYLYVPLGGNRRGALRLQLNLFLTMLLGGLWHGAAWTFVVWGGLHGLFLLAQRLAGGRSDPERPWRWSDAPRVILCFHAVCLAWVFFRAESARAAFDFFAGLAGAGALTGWPLLPTLIVAVCALLHPLERVLRLRLPELRAALDRSPFGAFAEGMGFATVFALAWISAGAGGAFIYFQF